MGVVNERRGDDFKCHGCVQNEGRDEVCYYIGIRSVSTMGKEGLSELGSQNLSRILS